MEKTNIRSCITIFGDKFDTDLLSELLNIIPTESYCKGDKSKIFKNGPCKKETSWEYSTGIVETYNTADVLGTLIDKFEGKVSTINDFVAKNDLHVKLYIIPIIEDNISPALYFDTKFLNFVHDLGAELDIDMYIN